jgi:hypothetical protein
MESLPISVTLSFGQAGWRGRHPEDDLTPRLGCAIKPFSMFDLLFHHPIHHKGAFS